MYQGGPRGRQPRLWAFPAFPQPAQLHGSCTCHYVPPSWATCLLWEQNQPVLLLPKHLSEIKAALSSLKIQAPTFRKWRISPSWPGQYLFIGQRYDCLPMISPLSCLLGAIHYDNGCHLHWNHSSIERCSINASPFVIFKCLHRGRRGVQSFKFISGHCNPFLKHSHQFSSDSSTHLHMVW